MDDQHLQPQPEISGTIDPNQSSPQPQPAAPQVNLVPETVSEEVTTEEFVPTAVAPEASYAPEHGSSNKSRIFLVIGAILVFIIFFVVIFKFLFKGDKKVASKTATIKYWGLWEDKATIEPILQEYKRKNPGVTIEYTKMDPKNYREKLINRDETVTDRPDIFRFHNTWLPELSGIAAAVPKDIFSDEVYEKTFYPVASSDLKIDKNYFGIPLEIDGLILIYNSALFKAAGIDKAPTTWEEVIEYAAKLTVKDESGKLFTSGIALGTATNIEHFSDILGWMILQNGGDLKNLTSAESVGALQQFRTFAEIPTNLWDETMPNSIAAFAQEKVAMIIAPSWQILAIKQANPDIALKTTLLPVVPGGSQISLANYWVEGVSRYSTNQKEAWDFLKFLSQKETMEKLYSEQTKTRIFGEPYSRVDLGAKLVQNEYNGPVIAQAKNMKSLPVISRTHDNGLNDEIVKYLENAVNATAQGVSYSDAFSTAQSGITQVFAKYNIK